MAVSAFWKGKVTLGFRAVGEGQLVPKIQLV